jgi:hypothetical protein
VLGCGRGRNESSAPTQDEGKCRVDSEHAAVNVMFEDDHIELFWLPDLSVVDEDIAV